MKNYLFLAALLPILVLTTASNMSCVTEEKKPEPALVGASAAMSSYAPEASAPEAPKADAAK